uniref:type II toxin-antitoxin system RelE/ParE family toxin n=1 Tax=Pigmentiphaga sp. CHJ604 TaxID=3081984 RepID=UPI00403EFB63
MQNLYRFHAQKDISAARRAVQAIRIEVGMLAKQPRVGRPIEGSTPQSQDGDKPSCGL